MRMLFQAPFLPIVSMEPLSGPQAIGASSGTSIGNFTQTQATFSVGLWRWQFALAPMRGETAREFRGWVTAMHGGANASRINFFDPDRPTPQELGYDVSRSQLIRGVNFSTGVTWSNGRGWGISYPLERIAAAGARGDTEISLESDEWGHEIGWGTLFGFTSHLALYMVTEVIEHGRYRIWPPLRDAITTENQYATLNPVLAMRLESVDAATMPRGLQVIEGATLTMVEVLNYDAEDYFEEVLP